MAREIEAARIAVEQVNQASFDDKIFLDGHLLSRETMRNSLLASARENDWDRWMEFVAGQVQSARDCEQAAEVDVQALMSANSAITKLSA